MVEKRKSRFKSNDDSKQVPEDSSVSENIGTEDVINNDDGEIITSDENSFPISKTEREISKRALQKRFIIFFILGIITMLAFNSFGPLDFSTTITSILFLLGIMTAYYFFSKEYVSSLIAKEHFADSFYYMGFIFTFVALTIAMYNLGSKGDLNTLNDVLSQIGIALTTTIYGLFIRVVMIQFNPILSDPDDDILSNIGELANSMEDLAKDFNKSLNISTSQVKSFHSTLTKDLEKFSESLKTSHNDMLENTLSKINQNLDTFGHSTGTLNSKIESFANNLEKLDLRAFGESMPNLSDSISSLNKNLNDIEVSLKSMTQSLESSSSDLKQLSLSASSLSINAKNAGQNFSQLNDAASDANIKFSDTNTSYKDLSDNMEKANNKMKDVEKSANNLRSTFEDKTIEIVNFLRKKTK